MAAPTSPDCLTALLGLSQGNSCYPLPTDPAAAALITGSGTGLYLDKAEGLRFGPGPSQTAAIDFYDRLKDARDLGAFKLRTDIEQGRTNSYGAPLYQQRGILGGQGNGQLAAPGTRALLPLATNARREGAWRVTKIQLFTDQAVTAAPLLLDGAQVGTIDTNAANGSAVLPNGGLLIPLDGAQHTIEVLLPIGVRVKLNKLHCPPCSVGNPWGTAVKATLPDVTAATAGNGFALSIVEECTAEPDLLCFAVGKDDGQTVYRYPGLVLQIGAALLYKAAQLFTDSLLVNQQLSRYTMLEPKALVALSDKYASEVAQRVAWLNSPDGLGQVQHPCFMGKPTNSYQPGKLWTG